MTNLWNYLILAHFRTGGHAYWYFGDIRNSILNASCEENGPITEFFVFLYAGHPVMGKGPTFKSIFSETLLEKTYFVYR